MPAYEKLPHGDTICFSPKPYRFKITGRISQQQHFERKLSIENTDKALAIACKKTQANLLEYSVAPIYMQPNKRWPRMDDRI